MGSATLWEDTVLPITTGVHMGWGQDRSLGVDRMASDQFPLASKEEETSLCP